ncbi:MAG: Smr/MutS family protein [Myxococcales bacterium]|nr:Smr/MutS family protein [Myxococcales bacterium]
MRDQRANTKDTKQPMDIRRERRGSPEPPLHSNAPGHLQADEVAVEYAEEDAYFERVMMTSEIRSLDDEDEVFCQYMEPPAPSVANSQFGNTYATSKQMDVAPTSDEELLFKDTVQGPGFDSKAKYSDENSHILGNAEKHVRIRRILKDLRSGKLSVDITIDLHNKRLDEAKRELRAQIPYAHRTGARVGLVITGKGQRTEPVGILRQEIPKWIIDELGIYVEAIHDAPGNLGGTGAQIVVLRRDAPTK